MVEGENQFPQLSCDTYMDTQKHTVNQEEEGDLREDSGQKGSSALTPLTGGEWVHVVGELNEDGLKQNQAWYPELPIDSNGDYCGVFSLRWFCRMSLTIVCQTTSNLIL